jgi:hypothetical protein
MANIIAVVPHVHLEKTKPLWAASFSIVNAPSGGEIYQLPLNFFREPEESQICRQNTLFTPVRGIRKF